MQELLGRRGKGGRESGNLSSRCGKVEKKSLKEVERE